MNGNSGLGGLNPPQIPGLRLRSPRGRDDAEVMARTITSSRAADDVDFVTTAEDLAADFENPTDFDPSADMLVAEVDGKMIGVSRIYCDARKDVIAYRHSADVIPEWRVQGLREFLFDWNERHIMAIAKESSTDDGRPRMYELWANDAENDWKSIVLRKGYREIHHEIDMVRALNDIPSIPVPEGFEVRPVRPEHYRAVWEANRDAWTDVWDYSEARWDDEALERFARSSRFCPDLWQIAWKGDVLAGMVLNYVVEDENRAFERKRGHMEFVYVREEFRGKGLARALLARSLRVLKNIGMEEVTLGAEVDNPHDAIRIYESIGFRLVKKFTWYQKPVLTGT